MKCLICLLGMLYLLTGCAQKDALAEAMELRQKITAGGCSFDAEITADYGDIQHSFSLQCTADADGTMHFEVLQPQSIAGITGTVSHSGGKLAFDTQAVAFPLMAEGQLSPVSGPWVMLTALRGGYLSSCCEEDDLFRLSIDDSYESDSLRLETWFDDDGCLTYCEIYWQGRMLLSMDIENFVYV